MLWQIKCCQVSLGVPHPLPSLTWKQIYIDDIKLKRNWRLGHYVKLILTGHTHRVLCVRVKMREGVMASGSSDQTIKIWSLKDGKLLNTIYTHSVSTFIYIAQYSLDTCTITTCTSMYCICIMSYFRHSFIEGCLYDIYCMSVFPYYIFIYIYM